MAKQHSRDAPEGVSRGGRRGQCRLQKIMALVLPENSRGRYRRIDVADVRYYFTKSAWSRGVMTRRWITEVLRNGVSVEPPHWSEVPIDRDGIYVRTEEGLFRLSGFRSLEEVSRKVGGNLLRAHESVLVNERWVHEYSSIEGELGVLVDGPDGKPRCERIQVSLRNKRGVEKKLWTESRNRSRRLPKPHSGTEEDKAGSAERGRTER